MITMNALDMFARVRHTDTSISLMREQLKRSEAERDAIAADLVRELGVDDTNRLVYVRDEQWRCHGSEIMATHDGKWVRFGETLVSRMTAHGVALCSGEVYEIGLVKYMRPTWVIRPLSAEVK